jgi:hypothetical protein
VFELANRKPSFSLTKINSNMSLCSRFCCRCLQTRNKKSNVMMLLFDGAAAKRSSTKWSFGVLTSSSVLCARKICICFFFLSISTLFVSRYFVSNTNGRAEKSRSLPLLGHNTSSQTNRFRVLIYAVSFFNCDNIASLIHEDAVQRTSSVQHIHRLP